MINIQQYGGAGVFKWDKNYLFRVLTEGKNAPIKDSNIAAAFRQIDRINFTPERFRSDAYQDLDLEIGYGEKFTRPTVVAQMVTLLEPKLGGKYLDIGTGTGYFACLLGFIAGSEGIVYSIERVQWLWEEARKNADKYKGKMNLKFLFRDGSEGLLNQAPFDGIHISFAFEEIPNEIKMQLKIGAKLVGPTTDYNLRVITRLEEDHFEEEITPGFMFDTGKEGVA
ncbi:MAG: class I SAM-dependent methyltransferase [Candidatus Dojkabacteria bacterium]|nr:class I SAM-dependent methyltransferase [Candidatus Dojkabacteria bacterium]